jgi:hypothetical protein
VFWESNPTNIKSPIFRDLPAKPRVLPAKPWATHGDNGQVSSIHGHDLPEPWGGFDDSGGGFGNLQAGLAVQ